jgi:hypothetical protein
MKVGGRKILISNTLMVPEGEVVEFDCYVKEDDRFDVKFIFEVDQVVDNGDETPRNDPRVGLDFNFKHNSKEIECVNIHFRNFTKISGQSLREPFLLASTDDGSPVSLLASVYKYSSFYKVEFQIMLGGEV